MTNIFTHNGPNVCFIKMNSKLFSVLLQSLLRFFYKTEVRLSFWVKMVVVFVNLFIFASSSYFLILRKITWLNLQQLKTRGHLEHLTFSRQKSSQTRNALNCTRCPTLIKITSLASIYQVINWYQNKMHQCNWSKKDCI